MDFDTEKVCLIENFFQTKKVNNYINRKTKKKTRFALLKAMIYTNPTGKQNTFAAHQLPEIILLEMRPHKIPVSYANAFISPARPLRSQDLVENSVEKMIKTVDIMTMKYNLESSKRLWFQGREFPHLDQSAPNDVKICPDIASLLKEVKSHIKTHKK